jgi:hypothetical protein
MGKKLAVVSRESTLDQFDQFLKYQEIQLPSARCGWKLEAHFNDVIPKTFSTEC